MDGKIGKVSMNNEIFTLKKLYYQELASKGCERLIAINRIQNRSLCFHNIFVLSVYNYFIGLSTD